MSSSIALNMVSKTNILFYVSIAFSVAVTSFSVLYMAVSVFGAFNLFSSVPYLDMWDAVKFITSTESGSISGWFALHNEHLIVLTRILIWLDYNVFGGIHVFLITCNVTFMFLNAYFIYFFAKRVFNVDNNVQNIVILFSILPSFSFAQADNIVWEFQSQFFLAFLLPLLSLSCLVRCKECMDQYAFRAANRFYMVAAALATLTMLTMANGVLFVVSFFISAYSVDMDKKLFRLSIVLLMCMAIVIVANGAGESRIYSHMLKFFDNQSAYIEYVLLYIGNFSRYMFGSRGVKDVSIFVIIVFVLSIVKIISTRLKIKGSYLIVVTSSFVLYVIMTSALTALGRVDSANAFSSRYTTPALLGFSMAAMSCGLLVNGRFARNLVLTLSVVFLLASQVPLQARVVSELAPIEKDVAGFCAAYGINDYECLKFVYPDPSIPIALSRDLMRVKYGFVTKLQYSLLLLPEGRWMLPDKSHQLFGNIDKVSILHSDEKYVKISGWAFDKSKMMIPPYVLIVDVSNTVVGFAATGVSRPDVGYAVDSRARKSGFEGYVLSLMASDIETLTLYCGY